jgi:hypothetical protein
VHFAQEEIETVLEIQMQAPSQATPYSS